MFSISPTSQDNCPVNVLHIKTIIPTKGTCILYSVLVIFNQQVFTD